jgi:hypothetical protein
MTDLTTKLIGPHTYYLSLHSMKYSRLLSDVKISSILTIAEQYTHDRVSGIKNLEKIFGVVRVDL